MKLQKNDVVCVSASFHVLGWDFRRISSEEFSSFISETQDMEPACTSAWAACISGLDSMGHNHVSIQFVILVKKIEKKKKSLIAPEVYNNTRHMKLISKPSRRDR